MDTIRISGLRVEAIIGVHAWERKLSRPVLIDLELSTDAARAARNDAIADALDYQAVADAVGAFIGDSQYQLIETLAEKLAESLLRQFGSASLRVTVHKPGAVASAQDVSVTIERKSAG